MNKQRGNALFVFIVFILMLFGVGGWVANIVKLFSLGFDPITVELVLRIVGIFVAPLGAILGFL